MNICIKPKRRDSYIHSRLYWSRGPQKSESERRLCDRIRQLIVQLRAGGNPLFYEELEKIESNHTTHATAFHIFLQEKVTDREKEEWKKKCAEAQEALAREASTLP